MLYFGTNINKPKRICLRHKKFIVLYMTVKQILNSPLFNKAELSRAIYPDKPVQLLSWKIRNLRYQKINDNDNQLIRDYFKKTFNIICK